MSIPDLLKQLQANPIFEDIEPETLADLEKHLKLVQLDENDDLFCQGDLGECMYFLIDGQLDIILKDDKGREITIGEESIPGISIGEISLITGQVRAVTVTARSRSQLIELSQAGFKKLIESNPRVMIDLSAVSAPRLQRIHLSVILRELLGDLDLSTLLDLHEELTWQNLHHGEVLYRQGDPGDAAYIIVNGRLQIEVALPNGKIKKVDESGTGEIIGEFSLLTDETRSVTVTAIRETNIVKLTPDVFFKLIERYPRVMVHITRIIIDRHKYALRHGSGRHLGSINIAVIPADPEVQITTFIRTLVDSSTALDPDLHLSSQKFDSMFGNVETAQTPLDDPTSPVINKWLQAQENNYKFIFYEADPTWTNWTERCISQADRLLIVGHAPGDPNPGPMERSIDAMELDTPADLVLLHPPETIRPSGTRYWLEERNIDAIHHIRLGDQAHFHRLARRVAGESIMLVLSGGGARGFAHLGVLRALEELDIPIDMIGGTSMGSLLGAGIAMGRDFENMLKLAESVADPSNLLDYTLPYSSLFATKKITDIIQEVFQDLYIEDLWCPYFCVSSNLTQGEPLVHREGLLWKSVRASIAIPGIFAPLMHRGDVLVDGGAVNNFPVDIMRDCCPTGILIGVNMSPPSEKMTSYEFGPSISGWDVLWSRINPLIKPIHVPPLPANLMRSMEINSVYKVKTTESIADVLIEPEIRDYGTLDFAQYQPIIEVGYQTAIGELGKIKTKEAGRYYLA